MNLKIDRSKIKKIDYVTEPLTAGDVYGIYKPDYMLNLGLYDTKTTTNIVIMEDENLRSGYLFSAEGIGIRGEKELLWVSSAKAYNSI